MALFNPQYTVEILDSTLTPVARVEAFVPLGNGGNWLEYTSTLSDVGHCRFRVMTKDPLLARLGDILQPYQFNVRVTRGQFVVWQGVIVNNPHRTKKFIEIEAKTYLYLLNKILVPNDTNAAYQNDLHNFRHFTTGTMANNVQTVLTEAINNSSSNSAIKQLKIGTIENPLFPNYYKDSNNADLSNQPWNFGSPGQNIKFDFKSVLYVLKSFGIYSNSDFEITPGLQFNFRKLIGNVNNGIYFNYSSHGNIEDYDLHLNGERMANDLWGIAADSNFVILQDEVTQADSIAQYGRQAAVAGFSDIKNANLLRSRLNEQLRLISKPDTELAFTLNQRAYPLGQYGLGDAVRVRIVNNVINFDQQRRIVQIKVDVNGTGKETIVLTTNYPRPEQMT
jgi:hypothetical protein